MRRKIGNHSAKRSWAAALGMLSLLAGLTLTTPAVAETTDPSGSVDQVTDEEQTTEQEPTENAPLEEQLDVDDSTNAELLDESDSMESLEEAQSLEPMVALRGSSPLLATKCGIPVGTYKGAVPTGTELRLGGANRYETATVIANYVKSEGVSNARAVFVASGADFPDALALGALAAHTDWPIVLTAQGSLDANAKSLISSLKPTHIFIAGGTGAISQNVENQIKALAGGSPSVKRFAGSDRYETAQQIAACFEQGSPAFVTTGMDFPDAVVAGAPAAKYDGAIILTPGFSLDAKAKSALATLKPSSIYMVGGTWSTTDLNAATSASGTGATAKVVSGADRYLTSAAVANEFFGTSSKPIAFAVASDFPDALAGISVADLTSAPIVLTQATCRPRTIDSVASAASTRIMLGGAGVISSAAATTTCASAPVKTTGQKIADHALSQVGQWQDCTAVIERALRSVGVPAGDLGTQAYELTKLGGKIVTGSSLQVGDVVMWPGQHMAVYIGNGNAVHGGWLGYDTKISSATHYGMAPWTVVRFT